MKLMETQESESLHGSAESTNNIGSQLVNMTKVENTPFTIVEAEEGVYTVLGKYRISENLGTLENALEDAKRTDWERMMQVMGVMIENYNEKTN